MACVVGRRWGAFDSVLAYPDTSNKLAYGDPNRYRSPIPCPDSLLRVELCEPPRLVDRLRLSICVCYIHPNIIIFYFLLSIVRIVSRSAPSVDTDPGIVWFNYPYSLLQMCAPQYTLSPRNSNRMYGLVRVAEVPGKYM